MAGRQRWTQSTGTKPVQIRDQTTSASGTLGHARPRHMAARWPQYRPRRRPRSRRSPQGSDEQTFNRRACEITLARKPRTGADATRSSDAPPRGSRSGSPLAAQRAPRSAQRPRRHRSLGDTDQARRRRWHAVQELKGRRRPRAHATMSHPSAASSVRADDRNTAWSSTIKTVWRPPSIVPTSGTPHNTS